MSGDNGTEGKGKIFPLPSVLDLKAAQSLVADLKDMLGADAMLDASKVTHMGALCLQVLLSARKEWGQSGHSLKIVHASPEFTQAVTLLGGGEILEQATHLEQAA